MCQPLTSASSFAHGPTIISARKRAAVGIFLTFPLSSLAHPGDPEFPSSSLTTFTWPRNFLLDHLTQMQDTSHHSRSKPPSPCFRESGNEHVLVPFIYCEFLPPGLLKILMWGTTNFPSQPSDAPASWCTNSPEISKSFKVFKTYPQVDHFSPPPLVRPSDLFAGWSFSLLIVSLPSSPAGLFSTQESERGCYK